MSIQWLGPSSQFQPLSSCQDEEYGFIHTIYKRLFFPVMSSSTQVQNIGPERFFKSQNHCFSGLIS